MSRFMLIVSVTLFGITSTSLAQRDTGTRTPSTDIRGMVKSADKTSITITTGGGRDATATEKTYTLAKDVEVCTGGGIRMGGAFREAKFADIKEGTIVSISLSADQKSVESIVAEEPTVRGQVNLVDATKNTISVTMQPGRGEDAAANQTFTVTAYTEIGIDDGRGRRYSVREAKLSDIAQGSTVMLRLSLDKTKVTSIFAEGSTVTGTIKSVDADKRSVTIVTRQARGDDAAEEKSLTIAKDAIVVVDDGKGRKLSVKDVKLADVMVGSAVVARLSVDQASVMMLRAEGPTLAGILKGVDATKGTITFGIPTSRTEFEEKTFTVGKDAKVLLDGNTSKLSDLKVGENGPYLQLKLSLDQKTVQNVIARQPGSR